MEYTRYSEIGYRNIIRNEMEADNSPDLKPNRATSLQTRRRL